MVRSTDSRRARNSDSVMIGGRRRPVSRPSRRRCFLASSRVEPLTDRTSSLLVWPFGSRTWTTVSGGSSALSSGPSAEPRRRLRRRRRPAAVSPSRRSAESASSSGPPSSAGSADPSAACWAAGSWPALDRRVRVRVDRDRGVSGWSWAASASGRGPSASWAAGVSPASAASSVRVRLRLGLRLRRRAAPVPSSSAPPSPTASPLAGGPAALADGPATLAGGPATLVGGPAGRVDTLGWVVTGSGRIAGGWNTTGGGWNTAAGTLGAGAFSSPAARPPPALLLFSLSYSSLSSIRAISSQAPGRAGPRHAVQGRRSAAPPHAAREHIVKIGAGGAALTAALASRGKRAGPAALSLVSCLHVAAPLHHSNVPITRWSRPEGPANPAPAGWLWAARTGRGRAARGARSARHRAVQRELYAEQPFEEWHNLVHLSRRRAGQGRPGRARRASPRPRGRPGAGRPCP